MYQLLILIRNKLNFFFFKKICIVERKKKIIKNGIIIFLFNLLYNFNFVYLLSYLNVNILYKIDELYFYEEFKEKKTFSITPIFLTFKILKNNESNELTERIKKYDTKVPLKLFFINENININNFNKIYLNILKNFKNKELNYDINEVIDKRITDII